MKLRNLTESLEKLYEYNIPERSLNPPEPKRPYFLPPETRTIEIDFDQRFEIKDGKAYLTDEFEDDIYKWVNEFGYYDEEYDSIQVFDEYVAEDLAYAIDNDLNKDKLPEESGVYRIKGTMKIPYTLSHLYYDDSLGGEELKTDYMELDYDWKNIPIEFKEIERVK